MQEPDRLFHSGWDPVPANLYAPRGTRSTTVLCCTHSIAFTRMLTLQVCSNTLVSHRGVNAATQATRQLTEDTLLPMTPHKCTVVFSKEQICTHMHCSPYSTALGCTDVTYTFPTLILGVLYPQQTYTTATHRCSPDATHSCTLMCTHDTHCPCCPLSALSYAEGLTCGNTERHMCFCVFQVSLLASTKLAGEGEAKCITL